MLIKCKKEHKMQTNMLDIEASLLYALCIVKTITDANELNS